MKHTPRDFELDKQCQAMLEKAVSDADTVLKAFPRGPRGLTPDDVKLSRPFQDAKWAFSKAFASLQDFNALFVKKYKKELAAKRLERRAGGIGTDQRGVK